MRRPVAVRALTANRITSPVFATLVAGVRVIEAMGLATTWIGSRCSTFPTLAMSVARPVATAVTSPTLAKARSFVVSQQLADGGFEVAGFAEPLLGYRGWKIDKEGRLGPALDDARRSVHVPIVKVDEAMAELAVLAGSRIGVLATTLPSRASNRGKRPVSTARRASLIVSSDAEPQPRGQGTKM